MIYGTLRVRTDKQDEGRQEEALNVYEIDQTFLEKNSGKSTSDRPELQKMLLAVKKGDRIITESISRLGRNNEVMCKKKGKDLVSLPYS